MIRPPEIPPNFTHNIAQYAAYRGVSHPLIIKWIKDGKIPASCYIRYGVKNRFILIDPARADVALAGSLQETKVGKYPTRSNPEPPKTARIKPDGTLTEAKTAVEWIKADSAEFDLGLKQGRLIDKEERDIQDAAAAKKIRDSLLGSVSRISPLLISVSDQDEIEKILLREFTHLLKQLAKYGE